MEIPTYDDIVKAREVVHRHLSPTLLNRWPLLAARLGLSLLLKHENHQPTGAFKVRGGVYLLNQFGSAARGRGVIGCSTGNHGQSLAFAAQLFSVPCTVVVPEGNNPDKNAAIRGWGARLIEHGKDFDDAKTHCEELIASGNARYVHSANEPDLVSGVGTMALEIFGRVTPDVILVPIGLGSGICGTALVAAHRHPATQIIGVQSTGAPAIAESWRTGEWISHDRVTTMAEGLATRCPAELTMEIMRRYVSDIVLVTDEEIIAAMKWILHDTHNLAEPAGAATTAAAWKMRDQLAGKTVVAILSGGNCDLRLLSQLTPEQP